MNFRLTCRKPVKISVFKSKRPEVKLCYSLIGFILYALYYIILSSIYCIQYFPCVLSLCIDFLTYIKRKERNNNGLVKKSKNQSIKVKTVDLVIFGL